LDLGSLSALFANLTEGTSFFLSGILGVWSLFAGVCRNSTLFEKETTRFIGVCSPAYMSPPLDPTLDMEEEEEVEEVDSEEDELDDIEEEEVVVVVAKEVER
jgi:hypothetical protein